MSKKRKPAISYLTSEEDQQEAQELEHKIKITKLSKMTNEADLIASRRVNAEGGSLLSAKKLQERAAEAGSEGNPILSEITTSKEVLESNNEEIKKDNQNIKEDENNKETKIPSNISEAKAYMENENKEKKNDSNQKVKKKGAIEMLDTIKAEAGSQKMNRNRAEMVGMLNNYNPLEQTIELGDGKFPKKEILISSWNVAGVYSALKNDHLKNYISNKKPDIICLNETRLTDSFLKEMGAKWVPPEYTSYFNCCKIREWYSGTAILTKYKPLSLTFDIGIKKHDLEGRTITAEFEKFYLVACYVPNAGENLVGLDYRVKEWDPDFRSYLEELKKKKHVVLCGDLNCAYQDIDIHNPIGKEKFAGFTPEERQNFRELLGLGFVDTFRHFHPSEKKFSFFSSRFNNRQTNKGWRLDYFLVNKEGLPAIKDSVINNTIYGSDHLPIELIINPQFNK